MPTTVLASKPGAELFYELNASSSFSDLLVVFINGLVAPAAGWKPVIEFLDSGPSTLIYDRYGQGSTTTRDPLDSAKGKTPGSGHTYIDVVKDLHELIETVAGEKTKRLILVGNSVGVNIARLYAQHYPSQVVGALFLDSNVANKDFHDIWPDPAAPDFDPSKVIGDDVTLEQYVDLCKRLPAMFNSVVPSPEGLDRSNQKELLPRPDEPKLLGPDGKGIWLTVVKHDPQVFDKQSTAMMKIPTGLTYKLTEPTWNTYHEGLAKLSPRSTGLTFASGAGHFIQKDQPQFVAGRIDMIVREAEASC